MSMSGIRLPLQSANFSPTFCFYDAAKASTIKIIVSEIGIGDIVSSNSLAGVQVEQFMFTLLVLEWA